MARCPIHSILFLFLISFYTPGLASPYGTVTPTRPVSSAEPIITPPPLLNFERHIALKKRQDRKHFKTCGYYDGDPERPWIAPRGFNCRIDTADGLWGFCPSTVNAASDCGLHGYCFDRHDCTTGCGSDDYRTLKCGDEEQYCFTALWVFANDVSYTYVGCATAPDGRTIFPTPTTDPLADATDSSEIPSSSGETEADPSEPPEEAAADSSSPSEEAENDDNADSGGGPNNIGAIVGGVLGGVTLICISVVAAIYIMRRNRNAKDAGEDQYPPEPQVPMYYTYDAAPIQQGPVELDSARKMAELSGQGVWLKNNRGSKLPELPG